MRLPAPYPITYLNGPGLGVTDNLRRDISNGVCSTVGCDHLFDLTDYRGVEETMIPQGTRISKPITYYTLQKMELIALEKAATVAALAQNLIATKATDANRLKQTCQNIWQFYVENFQYKLDQGEQLRSPVASYMDRETGVDCDCFAISVSALLINLGIEHFFRKAKYSDSDDWSHVYVVVPKYPGADMTNRSNYFVIDPVLRVFDHEHPYNGVPTHYDHQVKFKKSLAGISGTTAELPWWDVPLFWEVSRGQAAFAAATLYTTGLIIKKALK